MPLPTVKCPVCHCMMSLDVLLADDSVREALLSIIDIHPQGNTFIKPLLRYVGLFAPAKSQQSHGRIAALVNELNPLIHAGQFTRSGITHAAPLDYWIDGINATLAAQAAGTLTLPLKSHGYLLEVIASRANASAAKLEQQQEAQFRKGEQRRAERQVRLVPVSDKPPTSDAEARERIAKLRQITGAGNTGISSIGNIAANLFKPKE